MKIAQVKDLSYTSRVYLIVGKEAFEREEAVAKLLDHLEGDLQRIEKPNQAIEECASLSFFSAKRILHLKEDFKGLEEVIAALSPDITLILEAGSVNRGSKIYKLCEKHGVVLDFPEEKPWEKEKSRVQWLINQGVSSQAAELMVQQMGTDTATLAMELEKLRLFTDSTITPEDVRAVCSVVPTDTIFKLSDALLARDAGSALHAGINLLEEGVSYFQLIRQIRSQFQTKFQVCAILSSGGSPQDVAVEYPYMRGRILDQNCRLAHSYGMERFRKAMIAIDASEALAKSGTSDERLLTERLIAGLVQ